MARCGPTCEKYIIVQTFHNLQRILCNKDAIFLIVSFLLRAEFISFHVLVIYFLLTSN